MVLNAFMPSDAFEIAINVAALGLICAWGTIVLCQLKLWHLSRQGLIQRPEFRMFGAPFTGILTLAFLLGVVVLMAFDYPVGTWTVASLLVIVPALILGWHLARGRIAAIAAASEAGQ